MNDDLAKMRYQILDEVCKNSEGPTYYRFHMNKYYEKNFIRKDEWEAIIRDLRDFGYIKTKGGYKGKPERYQTIFITWSWKKAIEKAYELKQEHLNFSKKERSTIYIKANNWNISWVNNGQQIIPKNSLSKLEIFWIILTSCVALIGIYEFFI